MDVMREPTMEVIDYINKLSTDCFKTGVKKMEKSANVVTHFD